MLTRLLSISIVCVFTIEAYGQLPSERFSPINHFGRYHGIGYSNGYHACKEGQCKTWSAWKPWESVYSFYGVPAARPNTRVPGDGPRSVYLGNPQSTDKPPSVGPSTDASSITETPEAQSNRHAAPMRMPHLTPAPQQSSDDPTSPLPPLPPLPLSPSPSDRGALELTSPATDLESLYPPPTVHSRRVPPGSHSFIQQSAFWPR